MATEFTSEEFDRLRAALRSPSEPPFETADAETYHAAIKPSEALAAFGLSRGNSAAKINQALKSSRIEAIAEEVLWDSNPTKMLGYAVLPAWFWEGYELGPLDSFWNVPCLSIPFPIGHPEEDRGSLLLSFFNIRFWSGTGDIPKSADADEPVDLRSDAAKKVGERADALKVAAVAWGAHHAAKEPRDPIGDDDGNAAELPDVDFEHLKLWYAAFVAAYPVSSEELALASARGAFPHHFVRRQWVRDLRGSRPMGRPRTNKDK